MSGVPLCRSTTQPRCIYPTSLATGSLEGRAMRSAPPKARRALEGLFRSPGYKDLKQHEKTGVLQFFDKYGAEAGRVKAVDTLVGSGAWSRIPEHFRNPVYRNLGEAGGRAAEKLGNAYERIVNDPAFAPAGMVQKAMALSNPLRAARLTMGALIKNPVNQLPSTESGFKEGIKRWLQDFADDFDKSGMSRADIATERNRRKARAKTFPKDMKHHWLKIRRNWYARAEGGQDGKTVGERTSDNYFNYYLSWPHALYWIAQDWSRANFSRTVKGIDVPYPY